ncbi:MAG: site-2 protease family protein [Dethiobacter sp.]|jgi:Zn-dependent protease|nr:site-2 protease family protein [Dethiobacter sp.]MBS3990147.1 site-2 protease family protein [Dethiobacter sp.]
MPNFFGGGLEMFYRIPALLLAITFHEAAHAFMAYRLGDHTAKDQGRLSLNPLKHLDPLGTLALLIFRFGWAKPVPVNPMYFRGDRRRGMFLVGLAGPATNFILAFLSMFALLTIPFLREGHLGAIIVQLYWYNVLLGIFNLLPLPPLDGSKVFAYFLPRQTAYKLSQLDQYGPLILILLIFTGALSTILGPLFNVAHNMISTLVSLLTGF